MRRLFRRRRIRDTWGMVRAPQEIRLVRASADSSGIRVRPERIPLQPDGSLRRGDWRLPGRSVVHPISDLSLRHELLNLPPMSSRVLHKAVWQHCLGTQSDDAEIEVSYARNARAGQEQDLLVVWASRSVVAEALESVTRCGLTVQRLVTPAVALTALLRAAGRPGDAAGSTVLVHIGPQNGSVACYTDGELVLGREFPLPEIAAIHPADDPDATGSESGGAGRRPAPEASSAEEIEEQILEEISRSILLFNHRLRGKRVARILLSSDGAEIDWLAVACADRFSLPTSRLIDELALDLSAFVALPIASAAGALTPAAEAESDEATTADASRRARDAAAPWVLPIAAAVCGYSAEPDINLMPAIFALQQHQRVGIRIATGVALFGFLAMSLYQIPYFFATSSIVRDLHAHTTLAQTTDRIVTGLVDLRGERERAQSRLDFLAARQQAAAVAHAVLGTLAAAATDSLWIDEFELTRSLDDETQLELRILGKIGSSTSALAQAQFNTFHTRLRSSPHLAAADVGPLQIETRHDGSSSLLSFELIALVAADGRQP